MKEGSCRRAKTSRKNPKWKLPERQHAIRMAPAVEVSRTDLVQLQLAINGVLSAAQPYCDNLAGRKLATVSDRTEGFVRSSLSSSVTKLLNQLDPQRRFIRGHGLPSWDAMDARGGWGPPGLSLAVEHCAVGVLELLRCLDWGCLAHGISTAYVQRGGKLTDSQTGKVYRLDERHPYNEIVLDVFRYVIVDAHRFTFPCIAPIATQSFSASLQTLDDLLDDLTNWPKLRPRKLVCVVELFGQGNCPKVFGQEVAPIHRAKYPVIEALVKAGPNGLGTNELSRINGNATKYLKVICKLDRLWGDAIETARKSWNRYKIKHVEATAQ